MRIKKTSESLTITVDLTDAPNMQMFSGVGYTANPVGFYTWAPRTAAVFVVDGAFHSIALHYDHSTGRMFKADDENMPNWIRDLVSEILVGRDVEWLAASYRADEYVIERRDETGKVVMSVAIVDHGEVRKFLYVKRDKYQARDFTITHSGDPDCAGDVWLRRNSSKAAV